ncbi:hypothetical protein SAMN05661096_01030 [Marivirga sericea]|uniref:Uncharacterized protein n=1 Tax=Marivirga sericea TaxID=1028 RepID=A0A1X7ISM0_9BACT|nr:hypothetical protein [Marivirga sericea]SMG18167.1 hypothetical protein SAMN05661096_01030 [Marivirga sericea]
MIKIFNKVKRKLLIEGKFKSYLLYAIGEILLVVIGILIAIKIDDINREVQLRDDEIGNYKQIIIDLKRDSALSNNYHKRGTVYLNTYFKLNQIVNDGSGFKGVTTDFLVSNIQFSPVTQNNHQTTIEKLRNNLVREQINSYFGQLQQVMQATDEFNTLISQFSRPYFLLEHEIFNNEAIFKYEDRRFPPLLGVSTVDTTKLKKVMKHQHFIPIISQLRMSIGFYLASIERSMIENHKIIKDLEGRI